MMRLRFNSKGWFRIIDVAVGHVDRLTGTVVPDRYGYTVRRLIFGPYDTAGAAAQTLGG